MQFHQTDLEKTPKDIHLEDISAAKPLATETLSSTTSRTRDTTERPKLPLSTRGLSSHRRIKSNASSDDPLATSVKTQPDTDLDKINLSRYLKAMAAPALEKLTPKSQPRQRIQKSKDSAITNELIQEKLLIYICSYNTGE